MDWRCGSSGRAPALQAWSPESSNQAYQKQTNKQNHTHTRTCTLIECLSSKHEILRSIPSTANKTLPPPWKTISMLSKTSWTQNKQGHILSDSIYTCLQIGKSTKTKTVSGYWVGGKWGVTTECRVSLWGDENILGLNSGKLCNTVNLPKTTEF
jgi:hypothetical protein